MKRREKKFSIGDVVEIDKWKALKNYYVPIEKGISKTRKEVHRINWGREEDPTRPREICLGIITGMKRFIEGEYYSPSSPIYSYDSYDRDYEPGGVVQDNIVTCWCVRTGYLNKELYFFEEDIQKVDPIHKHDIPMLDTGWTNAAREQMSRPSRDFERDEKGRFI